MSSGWPAPPLLGGFWRKNLHGYWFPSLFLVFCLPFFTQKREAEGRSFIFVAKLRKLSDCDFCLSIRVLFQKANCRKNHQDLHIHQGPKKRFARQFNVFRRLARQNGDTQKAARNQRHLAKRRWVLKVFLSCRHVFSMVFECWSLLLF